jgi:ketosteroid isomerase-like protein
MSVDENKAVVRRFLMEVLTGRNIDLVDQLLAPNYVNRGMVGVDRAGFKTALSGMRAAISALDIEIADLVAEGDSVAVRCTLNFTLANGKKVSARDITFFRLSNGKIVEDDPMSAPDLTQLLGSMMSP